MNIFEQLKKDSEFLHLSKEDKADVRDYLVNYIKEGGEEARPKPSIPLTGKIISGLRSLRTVFGGRFGTIENVLEKKNNDR